MSKKNNDLIDRTATTMYFFFSSPTTVLCSNCLPYKGLTEGKKKRAKSKSSFHVVDVVGVFCCCFGVVVF